MIGKLKGYKVEIILPKNASNERKKIIKAFGAKLIIADNKPNATITKLKDLITKYPNKYFNTNQYANPENPLAHTKTADEIIYQLPNITHLVAGIGTSGTLMGLSKRLKDYNSKIKIIATEPQEKHKIQGLKNLTESIIPNIYNKEKIDKTILVYNNEAYSITKELALKEGLLVGISSGANMFSALKIANKIKIGNIVVIFPDRGEKYLSTDLFD